MELFDKDKIIGSLKTNYQQVFKAFYQVLFLVKLVLFHIY